MNTKNHQNFVRKTTALLGAIAASSFLGLPVLAQTNPNAGNTTVQCVPSSSRSSSMNSTTSGNYSTSSRNSSSNGAYSDQMSSRTGSTPSTTSDLNSGASTNQTSQSSRNTSTSSADDSGTPGVREYPNQTDPRTGVNPSANTGSTQSSGDVTAGTTSNPDTQSSAQDNGPRSGDVPSGNSISRSRTDTSQSEVQSVSPTGPQGQSSGSMDQSSSTTSYNSGSYSSSNRDVYVPNRVALAQANATSGAQVRKLTNQGIQQRNSYLSGNRVSYGYGQDQNQNQSQLPTSGVTSGAQTTQTIARCPEGMVPSSQITPSGNDQYQNQNQNTPDRNNVPREQTAPDAQTNGR